MSVKDRGTVPKGRLRKKTPEVRVTGSSSMRRMSLIRRRRFE